ncbi:AAA family ATPase [Marinobacter sp. M216]|uniref:AAA family ATPase n=1 Tax=Marinobacter albus TaxID=3030833 RepID=A0ABT7HCI0_9GAMM|nr:MULTISPECIES: ExeA family protein [unclassified Marinobacter]MBW7470010.1 AAA family ATPase [Marinobacter sp. F4218]MDK9557727.1 AAA family ATPase [Marinobacter sp. M216]
MYYDFFGFREPPFSIAPDPRYLYLSERHKEALAHLMYGVQGQGGFIVITGEVGTGKTTVSRCFIENAPDHVDIALILNPRLSARELLSSICGEMGVSHKGNASVREMVDLINKDLLQAHAAGRHKVLMIDEAQNLSADVLEQLRLLTNLETAEKKLLQIVLLGQPELQQILALPELRQLNQRVTARYHLDAIGKSELPNYLRYRLSVAGMRGDIFTAGAVTKLYRESQGIPRLINLISDRALLGAYAEGEHEITATHIRHAAREVRGDFSAPASSKSGGAVQPARYLMLTASLLVAVIGTAWLVDRWPVTVTDIRSELAASAIQAGIVEREEPGEPTAPPVSESESSGHEAAESADAGKPKAFRFPEQSRSLPDAFRSLFKLWERDYSPALFPVACQFALEDGLGCLERQGSRRSLEFLDRPAILELQDGSGNRGYVVLSSLEGEVAEIRLPDGSHEVSFASIEPFWFGGYRVLWNRPEFLSEGPANGSRSEQLWLGAKMMELADRYSTSVTENGRIKRMSTEEQVRWYQGIKGLTVDGIAGAMTIIQINNDLDADVPRLAPSASPEGQ